MREPIENEYFNWLCAKVIEPGNPNYRSLLEILHRTEFICIVHADTHRAMDGQELRYHFTNETGNDKESGWYELPASILEVFVSFANTAWFQTDIPVSDWFWEFMTNLGLNEYRRVDNSDVPAIENILNTFNMRTYDSLGNGGLFPLSQSPNDQRKIEIWYQFCEYVRDKGLF